MTRYLLIGTCAAILGGGGVALAQMPPGPDGQPGPMGPDRMMMRHMRHGWSSGTRFHFRKGDAEVDIRCSSQEPLQSCVTGATTLLDKLNATTAAKPAP